MAALTAARNTPQLAPPPAVLPSRVSVPVADNVKIYPGSLVVISGGYAAPATAAANLLPAGMYDGSSILDNTGTGHAAAAFEVPIACGIFKWVNKSTDALAQANVGASVYAEDSQTVRATSTGSSAVGKLVRVDTDGVWVLSFIGQL